MAVNLSPVGGVAAQFFTNNGVPLSGGKLYTYAAGTTTPQATYTTSNGATAWTNPIVLDSAGRVPSGGEIWLTDGLNYKFVLKDSNDVTIATYDNISGINSNFIAFVNQQEIVTATAGQTVFNLGISYQPGTNSLSVFVDGVNQYGPGALYSYVETDSNTVTFNTGLHVGAEVKFTTTQQQGAGAVDAQQVSYVPPFTGSVATNVEAKLAQTVSAIDFGAKADFGGTTAAQNNIFIQTALDSFDINGGTLVIPKGVKWDYAGVTHPNEVNIWDQSGWDYVYSAWTAQEKLIMQTASPGAKNANEFQLIAPYHPALIIDNVGDGLTEKRASVIFRHQGSSIWQIGPGSSGTNLNYKIAVYGSYAGSPTAGTNVFEIDRDTGTMGWNARYTGIDFTWRSARNTTASFRSYSSGTNDIEYQAGNTTNGLLYRQQISGVDGSWGYVIGGTQRFKFGADASFTSWNRKVTPRTGSYTVLASDAATIFTNTGATGGFSFTLPLAVVGMQYEFYVTEAQNVRLLPNASDAFRGYTAATGYSAKAASKYMESSTQVSVCKIKCVQAGYWEFERLGTWTDQP